MATADEATAIAAMLRDQANKSIAFSKEYGTQNGAGAKVTLKVKRETKGDFVRLWGRHGGPRGRVVQWGKGETIAMFDAQEILAAADRLEATALGVTA